MFPLGTTREEVPERLELYMKCRYERATMIQNFSRQAAFKISAKDDVGGTSTDRKSNSKIRTNLQEDRGDLTFESSFGIYAN